MPEHPDRSVTHLREVVGRRDLRLILGASLVAAGGRGLDIVAPFMVLYLSGPLGFDQGTVRVLYALLLVGAVVGPILAGTLSDRFGRRRTLVTYYLASAVGIVAFLAAGANLLLLVPLLLPFGTAVFSESPVLQAYLADRATGPLRDMAFAVYFTFAFGIGAVLGVHHRLRGRRVRLPGGLLDHGRVVRGGSCPARGHP